MNFHSSTRELLLGSFRAALAAVDPLQMVPPHLPAQPKGRTLVVGAGKAAAAMALAVERHWPPQAPLDGIVVTRYAHGLLTNRITVIEAGHPVPDEAGATAAQAMLDRVTRLSKNDLLIALFSGGGSSLLALPVSGVSLADLQAVTAQLLRCGAAIQEINTVRKHLSLVQGGRLAAACKAPIRVLTISDVAGDDPTHIASGPCTPDPTRYADALEVLARYRCDTPAAVLARLTRGARGELAETPKTGDPAFALAENRIIAAAHPALRAAASYFKANGIAPVILGDSVTGEAREVAKVYAALAREIRARGHPFKPPVALISGGECTVSVRGGGRGGRCTEFLLSLVRELNAADGICMLACDTDGIDGTQDNAGALAASDTLARAERLGLHAGRMLDNNDSYSYFAALGDLVITGPTRTNVNDYRVILVS